MQRPDIRLIDTHCHLYSSEFDEDRTQMIERAIASGVERMMLPNIDLSSVEGLHSICSEFPDHCFPMIGLHPCSVKENYKEELEALSVFAQNKSYVGIGETGVDLFWDTSTRKEQVEAFEIQIDWAKKYDLPVIIHSRESLDLNISIIESHQDGRLRGIFHCFTGTEAQAKSIARIGFKIGIGGVVTFKNSGLDQILPNVSKDSIVLETDAPYLAPVPFRGKRNESSYLSLVAEKMAQSMAISVSEVASFTTANALEVFGKID